MAAKIINSKSITIHNDKNLPNFQISIEKLSPKEKKLLIDSLVDPIFVISNANFILKTKLEKFLDEETRENFYIIDRAQKKLVCSIDQLRYGKDSI